MRIKDLLEIRVARGMCEVAHTSLENWPGIADSRPGFGWGTIVLWEGVMPRSNPWSRNMPRVELDQRSREARLRLERIDRLFILRATATHSRLRRLLYLFTVRRYGGLPQEGGVEELRSDRWRSSLPMLLGLWLIG